MACITTCSKCGRCYQEISEEEANAPNRLCAACFAHPNQSIGEQEEGK